MIRSVSYFVCFPAFYAAFPDKTAKKVSQLRVFHLQFTKPFLVLCARAFVFRPGSRHFTKPLCFYVFCFLFYGLWFMLMFYAAAPAYAQMHIFGLSESRNQSCASAVLNTSSILQLTATPSFSRVPCMAASVSATFSGYAFSPMCPMRTTLPASTSKQPEIMML